MKIRKIFQSLFLLCSIIIFISCEKESACNNEISKEDIDVVYFYNAYYDFFNVIETFDFEALTLENILDDKGANSENAIRYELNFPDGYVDRNGNQLSGKINYASKFLEKNTIGNIITFDLEDLKFNEMAVVGEKIINVSSAEEMDWCSGNGISFSNNSTSASFKGCLSKAFTAGEMEISGSSLLVLDDIEYKMEIKSPIIKSDNCSWFTSGELLIKGEKTTMLKFKEKCEGIEMTLSNEDGCDLVQLDKTHNLW